MLSDNVALALALVAVWLARRPATPERTYGFKRAEVLAALANGVTLVVLAIWIFYEAIRRFDDPPDVLGGWMLLVGVVGIGVNVAGGAILFRARGESLNVEAAFRHVLADLLGSLGVVIAAVVILATGGSRPTSIASVLIGLLVLASSWTILRDSTSILLESAPRSIDTRAVGARLAGAPGVVEVHDLHLDDHVRVPGAVRPRPRRAGRGLPRTAARARGVAATSSGSTTRRSRSTTSRIQEGSSRSGGSAGEEHGGSPQCRCAGGRARRSRPRARRSRSRPERARSRRGQGTRRRPRA